MWIRLPMIVTRSVWPSPLSTETIHSFIALERIPDSSESKAVGAEAGREAGADSWDCGAGGDAWDCGASCGNASEAPARRIVGIQPPWSRIPSIERALRGPGVLLGFEAARLGGLLRGGGLRRALGRVELRRGGGDLVLLQEHIVEAPLGLRLPGEPLGLLAGSQE